MSGPLSFEQLPQEIHLNIFDYIPKQSLKKCAIVSKLFCHAVTHILKRMELEELFSKRMIEGLGGYDNFLKIPTLKLNHLNGPSLCLSAEVRLIDLTAPLMKGTYFGSPFIMFLAEEVDTKICRFFYMRKPTSTNNETMWCEGGTLRGPRIFSHLSLKDYLNQQEKTEWDIARNFFLGKEVTPKIGNSKFVICTKMPKVNFKLEDKRTLKFTFIDQLDNKIF